MNCAFDKERLTGYYDGELAAAEKSEVERHIASCSECLRDLGELKSAALLIKELPRLRAPKSIAQGVSREIQAAGKVHSLAKVRSLLLWTSAAAAGLFVLVNVIYLSDRKSPEPRTGEPSLARSVAKVAPAEVPPPAVDGARFGAEPKETDRALRQEDSARRRVESRKDLAEPESRRTPLPDAEGAAPPGSAKQKNEAGAPAPVKTAEALAKAADPQSAAPAPPAAPTAPAKPGESRPAPDAAPPASLPLAEKAASKDSEQDRKSADAQLKVASVGASAELPPVQYNVLITQIAKARPRLEESLKKMGVTVLAPAPQPVKPQRNRESENTIVLELTDAQLLKLCEELEKPGDARMVPASPVEPVLPGFRGGGLFANKKETASGGAGRAPAAGAKDKSDDAGAQKGAAEASTPAKRRVILHLVESNKIPPAEGDAVPPQKN